MRRAPLIIAGLVVVVVLGWLGYGTRNKPEAPALAALPSVAQSSAPSAARDPVVSDVQAAVPAAPVVADVSPTPSKIAPALPAPARPGVPPPRAMEPAPGGPRYTYFGGRR